MIKVETVPVLMSCFQDIVSPIQISKHSVILRNWNQQLPGIFVPQKKKLHLGLLLLMAEILHQLRLLVYPMISEGFTKPSKRWSAL